MMTEPSPPPPQSQADLDAENIRYIFALARVEANPNGTFTLYAPKASGRTIINASYASMLDVVEARWGGKK